MNQINNQHSTLTIKEGVGGTAPLTKNTMFCTLSQNYQHLFDKWYTCGKYNKEMKNATKI